MLRFGSPQPMERLVLHISRTRANCRVCAALTCVRESRVWVKPDCPHGQAQRQECTEKQTQTARTGCPLTVSNPLAGGRGSVNLCGYALEAKAPECDRQQLVGDIAGGLVPLGRQLVHGIHGSARRPNVPGADFFSAFPWPCHARIMADFYSAARTGRAMRCGVWGNGKPGETGAPPGLVAALAATRSWVGSLDRGEGRKTWWANLPLVVALGSGA